jgi:hypothetical protein
MTKRCCAIARGFGDLRLIWILYPRFIVQQGGIANPACLNPNVSCRSIALYWLFAGHIRSAPINGHRQTASPCRKSAKSAVLTGWQSLPLHPQNGPSRNARAGPFGAGRRHSILDASPHSAAGLIFRDFSLAASRRNMSLRFLTLAVAAPAHHLWCQFFIAARW